MVQNMTKKPDEQKLEELVVDLYIFDRNSEFGNPVNTKETKSIFIDKMLGNGSLTSRIIIKDEKRNSYFAKTYLHTNKCSGTNSREILINERAVQEHLISHNKNDKSYYYGFTEINDTLFLLFKDMNLDHGKTLKQELNLSEPDFNKFKDTCKLKTGVNSSGYTALNLESIINYTTQIVDQVQSFHGAGILHADISPDNILIVNGKVIVNDFGIARKYGGEMKHLYNKVTVTGVGGSYYGSAKGVLHNVIYSPPDVDKLVEAQANYDTYLITNLLCLMATGRLREYWNEEMGKNPGALKHKLKEEFKKGKRCESSSYQKITDKLYEIILKGTNSDPNERFLTATELGEAIRSLNISKPKEKEIQTPVIECTIPDSISGFEPNLQLVKKYFGDLWDDSLKAYVPIVEKKLTPLVSSSKSLDLDTIIYQARKEREERVPLWRRLVPGGNSLKNKPQLEFQPHMEKDNSIPELYFNGQVSDLEDKVGVIENKKNIFSSKFVRNTIIGVVGLAGALAIGYGAYKYFNDTGKSTVQSVKKINIPKYDLNLPIVLPVEKDAGAIDVLAEDVTQQDGGYDVSTIAQETVVNSTNGVENVPKIGSMNSFPGNVWPVNLSNLEKKVKKQVSYPVPVKKVLDINSIRYLSLSLTVEPIKEKYAPDDIVTLNYKFAYVKNDKWIYSIGCKIGEFDIGDGGKINKEFIKDNKIILTFPSKNDARYNNPNPLSLELICESEDKQSVSKKFIFTVAKPVEPVIDMPLEIKLPKFPSMWKPKDSQSKYSIFLSSGEMCYGCEFKVQSKDIEIATKGNCLVSEKDSSFILSPLNSGSKYVLSYKIDRKIKLPSSTSDKSSGVNINVPISCSFEDDTFTYSANVKIISDIIDKGSYINIHQWSADEGKILLKSGEECVGCMVDVDPPQKDCILDKNSAGFSLYYVGSGIYKLDRNDPLGSPNFINYKVVMRCPSEGKGSIFRSLFLNVMKVKYNFGSP